MGNKETKLTHKFYSQDVSREWERLVKDPYHRLEFDTTLRFLEKYLPKRGLILDAGGGPGRYSIELAKRGYDVVLLDLVPEHLEFAKYKIKEAKVQSKIKEIVAGTVTDLSTYKNNSFDAVICLGGVVSHVNPEKERKKAISELVRVAKKNAPIFVSVMGKLGTITQFKKWINEIEDTSHFKQFYLEGDDYQWNKGKAYAHFFELKEFNNLFGNKVNIIANVGLEGLATPDAENFNEMAENNKKAFKNWIEMHYALCTNPNVVEVSAHFMTIVKKK